MNIQPLLTKSVFILLLFVTTAYANSIIPAKTALNKSEFQLVGEAQFSVMFWDIYKSRLFTKSGEFNNIDSSVLFEITYQRDITKQQLIERTVEQWQKMKITDIDYRAYVAELNNLWPNISSGDKLALQVGDSSSHFYFNDNYLGSIAGQQFAQLFLGIWLSPKTTEPELRKTLLEGKK